MYASNSIPSSGHIGRVSRRSSGGEEGRARCRQGVAIAEGREEEAVRCVHSSDCTVVAQGEGPAIVKNIK